MDVDIRFGEITTVRDDGRCATLELVLDEDCTWHVRDGDRGAGDGTPVEEWHNRVRVYQLASTQGCTCYDADAVREWLEQHVPLLKRITAGHSVEWNGKNNVGCLTDDAKDAEEDLELAIEDANSSFHSDLAAWEAGEWLAAASVEELVGGTGETLYAEARGDDVVIIGGAEALQEALDEKRADAVVEALEKKTWAHEHLDTWDAGEWLADVPLEYLAAVDGERLHAEAEDLDVEIIGGVAALQQALDERRAESAADAPAP